MAQAMYDGPLHEYFRELGEAARTIPGGLDDYDVLAPGEVALHILPILYEWLKTATDWVYPLRDAFDSNFAERFKYLIISSSLLSSDLAPSNAQESNPDGNTIVFPPGTWNDADAQPQSSGPVHPGHIPLKAFTPVAVAGLAASFSSLLCLGGATLVLIVSYIEGNRPNDSEPTKLPHLLDSLSQLIGASSTWDLLVGQALNALDSVSDQHASAASVFLRNTLHTTLDRTIQQSDNIRHLFSPLTTSVELTMLSEMYAPSSPSAGSEQSERHASLGTPKAMDTFASKRATWSGLTSSRNRHHWSPAESQNDRPSHERTASLRRDQPPRSPPSPSAASFMSEDDEGVDLPLRRRRAPLGSSEYPSHSPLSPAFRKSNISPIGISRAPLTHPSSPSPRLMPPHVIRRPQSLSSLHTSVNGALASRRYAASHLLALRFFEDASDPYWDDVAALVSVFTGALEQASAPLKDALSTFLRDRLAEQTPTPPITAAGLPLSGSWSFDPSSDSHDSTPAQLAALAAHIDAVSRSLESATDELRLCVAALQSPACDIPGLQEQSHSLSSSSDPVHEMVLSSYARLRRELLIALRECDRGKAPLENVLGGRTTDVPLESSDESADFSDAPLLETTHPVAASAVPAHLPAQDGVVPSPRSSVVFTPDLGDEHDTGADAVVDVFDDLNAGERNPFGLRLADLPEQVFEVSTQSAMLFNRERSKLSREERIALAKKRRLEGSSTSDRPSGEGGSRDFARARGNEVMEELKSIIDSVGESRRAATAAAAAASAATPFPSLPQEQDDLPPSVPTRPQRPSRPAPPPPELLVPAPHEPPADDVRIRRPSRPTRPPPGLPLPLER